MLGYKNTCHFARESQCDLGKRCCWLCHMYLPNIRDLSRGDHIALALAREAGVRARMGLVVSLGALVVALVALAAHLLGLG